MLLAILRGAGYEPGKEVLKNKDLFSGKGKEVTGKRDQKPLARISCSPFPGESWHLATGIYDPGPVVVASQGSSLSHSA